MPFGDTPGTAAGRGRPDFMMPQGELITSALSNRGNPTGYGQENTFRVREAQEIRIFDNNGNLLFSGAGPEAAKKAVAIGQNLSDTLGRKAGWTIQTGDQYLNTDGSVGGTRWNDVANENTNKSTLGKIASVVGTALPIAVGFIPGIGQLATGLQIAIGAGAGAAGAGLRGKDILKGGLMGGLSAAGGTIVGDALKGAGMGLSANAARAIGTGIGTTTGGVVTGQSLGDALLGGVTSGGLSYLGGEVFGKRGGTTTSGGGDTGSYSGGGDLGDIVLTAGIPRFTGALFPPSFADKAQLNSNETNPYQTGDFAVPAPAPAATDSGLTQNNITVTATPTPTTGTSTFAVGAPKINTDFSVLDEILVEAQKAADTTTAPLAVGGPDIPVDTDFPDEILVEAQKAADTTTAPLAVGGPDIPVDTDFPDEIIVEAKKTEEPITGSSVFTVPGLAPLPQDIIDAAEGADTKKKGKFGVDEAMLALSVLNALSKATEGSGKGRLSTAGQELQPIFSAKLPTPGVGGAFQVGGLGPRTPGAAGTFSARPTTDWYRFGMGPAMDIAAGTDLSGATSPYAGYGPGTLGEETFRAVSGIPEKPVGMYEGGAMGYARGSDRDSFAVEGPGTGRSDDIPAVLSDGEYVIDAETVALLGDGSSKAGAKKLDELRVKVRKHKGRNLAKGKFSVNAKAPDKYLSGGRV